MGEDRVNLVMRELQAAGDEVSSDAQLLERFVANHDGEAFAALLRRHGPMVLGVCQRILGRGADAEDAFQATFVVLARKAASLRQRERLGNWLYGVAYRTALRARALANQRRLRETAMSRPEAVREEPVNELLALLDQELNRLPDKYRTPIILCELEGKTYKEAAQLLGWPEGTVAGRLSRARALLAQRLSAHGPALSAAALVELFARSASASVPAALGDTTNRVVLMASEMPPRVGLLVEQAMKTLLLSRLRSVLALGVMMLAVAGAGLLAAGMTAKPPQPQPKAPPPEKDAADIPLTDLFGDPLPEGAVARLGTMRFRHRGPILSLVVSPNGKRLISAGSADHLIRFWEAGTGREIRRLKPGLGAFVLALSPDGKMLASCGGNDGIHLWDTETSKPLRRFESRTALCLAFSPDGKTLASGGFDKSIHLREVATGKELATLKGHEGTVGEVRFALGGKVLASLAADKTFRLWDLKTGKETHRLLEDFQQLQGLTVSPDGKTLAVGGGLDGTLRLWKADTGKELSKWKAHDGWLTSVTFSPDGQTLASVGLDTRLKLWDYPSGKLLRETTGVGAPGIGGGGNVQFLADGKTLACTSNSIIRLFDVEKLEDRRPNIARQQGLSSVVFSPDGKSILTGLGDINATSLPGGVRIWEPTGKEIQHLAGPPGPVFGVALTPDGKTVIGSGWDSEVWLWDRATGKERRRLGPAVRGWRPLALSPDGKHLAVNDSGGILRIWDVSSGKERYQTASAGLSPASISPDSKTLALGSGHDDIVMFDLTTGKLGRHIKAAPAVMRSPVLFVPPVNIVAFSPDGKRLASWGGHDAVRIWNAVTGKELHRLTGHKDYADSAAFSPDGRTLAVGDSNGMIRLWETSTGKERRRLVGHEDRVVGLAFSPDGRLLVSASHDSTGLVWDVRGK